MTNKVVVLGSGYAGTGAIKRLESAVDQNIDITWVSDVDHHFVLHESHRCIRDLKVADKITFSIESVKSPSTRFINDEVVSVDRNEQIVHLDSGTDVPYDYLIIAIGSRTAFFGIDGLRRYAHTLKRRADVEAINSSLQYAAREASRSDPANIIVGGAGLSGIQSSGEIAAFRDAYQAPINIHLVEGLDSVLPNSDPVVQETLESMLKSAGVTIHTGEFISEVDAETVYMGEDESLSYDVLLWTGGITGRDVSRGIDLDKDERNYRLKADPTFQTSDDRIFALGDAALIDQPQSNHPAPPTAQAAWQAAEVVADNVIHTTRDEPLKEWTYDDLGTLISVGDKAVAHNVAGIRAVKDTIKGPLAVQLKKAAAVRWIRKVVGTGAALRAYPKM